MGIIVKMVETCWKQETALKLKKTLSSITLLYIIRLWYILQKLTSILPTNQENIIDSLTKLFNIFQKTEKLK